MDDNAARARRRFLKLGALATCGAVAPTRLAGAVPAPERRLAFYQTHTGESLELVYWAAGAYVPESLASIDRILRDHRTGEVSPIRPQLLDLLAHLRAELDSREPFHVISGFRSAATNHLLHTRSRGVASHSLHMDGLAIDIRLPGRELALLRDCARSLRAGGVGFYPGSDFVHVDVGRVRYW
ncbi:MAG: DUF882 domain-containing protein [Betaproteobacteria bacterium]|nr:DUF882 domain-containing protein [Betaproteobacteria bacterium]